MPVSEKLNACFDALKTYRALSADLERVRNRLSELNQAISEDKTRIYFTNLNTAVSPDVSARATNKSVFNAADWPTPDYIQDKVNSLEATKRLLKRLLQEIPADEKALIQVPNEREFMS